MIGQRRVEVRGAALPRNRARRRRTPRWTIAVVALTAAGCSSPVQPTPGPLAGTQVPNTICAPVPAGEVLTARAADWDYREGAALTIDRVAVIGGESAVHLVTVVLVPSPVAADGSASGIGAVTGFPPALESGMTERWDLRYPAVGGIHPASTTQLALFVVLQRVAPTVETTSLSVEYHRGDERFAMTIPVRCRLVTDENGC